MDAKLLNLLYRCPECPDRGFTDKEDAENHISLAHSHSKSEKFGFETGDVVKWVDSNGTHAEKLTDSVIEVAKDAIQQDKDFDSEKLLLSIVKVARGEEFSNENTARPERSFSLAQCGCKMTLTYAHPTTAIAACHSDACLLIGKRTVIAGETSTESALKSILEVIED